jgi:DNA primase
VFNVADFLSQYVSVRDYNESNISIICPYCGKGKNHFLVSTDPNKKVFHCFHCGKSGNWASLVVKIKGVNYAQARELVDTGLYFQEAKEKKKLDLPKIEFPPVTAWTDETWKHLADRGIDEDTAYERQIYYCGYGKYANRIILPIYFMGKRVSFQARTINGDSRKYINPKGFPNSKVLYNYDNYANSHMVIVEGIFDCLRIDREGIMCMATLGKEISSDQIELLVDLGVKGITLFYDPDALPKMIKLFPTLEKIFPSVCVAVSQDGKDPAETEMLHEALDNPLCSIGELLEYSISRRS